MTVYFGSDLHFDHKHILSFCKRPFTDLEVMKDKLLEEFHDTISKGDVVYLLGDIQFCTHTRYLEELTKRKDVEVHLIHGNHDSKKTRNFKGWKSSSMYKDIKVEGKKIALFHYPIAEWNCKDHGSYHLHGHTHGLLSHPTDYVKNRLDVGYDNLGRVLFSFEEVETKITQDVFNYHLRRYSDGDI